MFIKKETYHALQKANEDMARRIRQLENQSLNLYASIEEYEEQIAHLRRELENERHRHDKAIDFCASAMDSGFIQIPQEELGAPIRREDIPDDEYAE